MHLILSRSSLGPPQIYHEKGLSFPVVDQPLQVPNVFIMTKAKLKDMGRTLV